jgi:hypothetical protein
MASRRGVSPWERPHADHDDLLLLEEQDVAGELLGTLAGQTDHDARAELITDAVEQAQTIAPTLPTVIRRVELTVECRIAGFDA